MRIGSHNLSIRSAFTMVEVMLSIAIFAMVLSAIYASWSAVSKSANAGLKAAADAQRERMTRKVIEDAITTYQGFASSNYLVDVGQDGDFSYLSLVSRLPESFPGSGIFGGQAMRRVSFWVGPDEKRGGFQLFMSQFPPLLATNDQFEPYVIPLATDVTAFEVTFWDDKEEGFVLPESGPTNGMPKQIQVFMTYGNGKAGHQVRTNLSILTPVSTAVTPDMQGASGTGAGLTTPRRIIPGRGPRPNPRP